MFCGSSFGAAVAIGFALRHIERVQALILIANAFGASHQQMGEGDLESYGDLGDRIAAEGLEVVATREAARTKSNRPLTRWVQHDEASLIAFLRAVPMYRPFKRPADLRAVTVPTLVIPGEDAIHTPELGAAYADALPNAKLFKGEAPRGAVKSFLDDFRTRD